jgi:hypothetical protein
VPSSARRIGRLTAMRNYGYIRLYPIRNHNVVASRCPTDSAEMRYEDLGDVVARAGRATIPFAGARFSALCYTNVSTGPITSHSSSAKSSSSN